MINKIKEKKASLEDGVKAIEKKIAELQSNRIATIGGIQVLDMLLKEAESPQEPIDKPE